jgi:hypothetical protein
MRCVVDGLVGIGQTRSKYGKLTQKELGTMWRDVDKDPYLEQAVAVIDGAERVVATLFRSAEL